MLAEIKDAVEFVHHLPRYREIITVLWKYDFNEELKLVVLEKFLGIEEKESPVRTKDEKPLGVRLRLALEELGPTFIKFGQVLSSRRDFLPDEVHFELCKLQDHVPPISGKQARAVVEKELGAPIKELFRSFYLRPVGAASIAQVHPARLWDGRKVAVKIQRPDIVELIEQDLVLLKQLARFADEHVPELKAVNPIGVVEEFSDALRKELDFAHEAQSAERFANQFDGNENIAVPGIYRELSNARVLTMDYIDGMSVRDVEALKEEEIDTVELSERLAHLIYEQVFDHGFFHGDPHPGNICILPDGVVGLFDYGMMGSFSPAFRTSLAQLLAGLARKDNSAVMNAILAISEEQYTEDPDRMLREVEVFTDQNLSGPLGEIHLGGVLNKLLELLRHNKLRMQGSFYLGVKAFTQGEEIGRTLNPGLNFVKLGEPYARRMMKSKYKGAHVADLVSRLTAAGFDFLEQLPVDFRNLYQRAKAGKFNLPIEHRIDPKGFEPMRETLHATARLLASSILTASILIGSSILIMAGMPPIVGGASLIGMIGLGWGTLLGLRLAFRTRRRE